MPASSLAKKHAVKEAVSKALRVGLGGVLTCSDMCISHDNLGDPKLIPLIMWLVQYCLRMGIVGDSNCR